MVRTDLYGMITIEFPMWMTSKRYVSLSDILKCLPENDWDWVVSGLHAVGRSPLEESMDEFEALIAATGFSMQWDEVKSFAEDMQQIINCKVVARSTAGQIVIIEAHDSTNWCLQVSSRMLNVVECLKFLSKR